MNFLTLCKTRYAVRSYQEKAVEPEKLEVILKAAQAAPTAANRQPVRLFVCQSEEALQKIRDAADIHGAPLAILVCCDKTIAWKREFDGKSSMDIDASIVTDHMMLAATDLALGSLWVCWFEPEKIRRTFQLSPNLEPVNILAIGYDKGEPLSMERHSQTRRPFTETVTFV